MRCLGVLKTSGSRAMSAPSNMRLKLTALLFKGTVMLPIVRHVRRSLSAIR